MAGNKNSGNHGKNAHGKGFGKGPDLVGRARAVLLRAMEIVDERACIGKNKPLAELIADVIVADPMSCLVGVSKIMPKELNIDHRVQSIVDLIGDYGKEVKKIEQGIVIEHNSVN